MEHHELVRASTPISQGGGGGSPFHLNPAMAERAAVRLCWVSVACALTAGFTFGSITSSS